MIVALGGGPEDELVVHVAGMGADPISRWAPISR